MAEFCGNETDRAAILALYDLDAAGFEALDEITDFAGLLCETPIALVSIVETKRQRFLARTGLDATETPRDVSFCAHAMLGNSMFVIPDATKDARFVDNGLVTGPPHIRFYAGAPLVSQEGVPLGALCVIDSKPRAGLTPLQVQGLTVLARQVVAHLHARRREHHVSSWAEDHAVALSESETKFRTLADAMPQMVWSTLPDGHHDYYNARWYEFTGVPEGSTDGEAWNGMFHPDDQDRAWARWRHSLETGEPYEIEYRLRHHSGDYRWTLGRAMPIRDAAGQVTRWFGTCTDIHEQKTMAEQREIVSHELSHRIKNIFSVIGGLIGLSAREHPGIAPVADELRERVMSLGRAHDYVRPHSGQSASAMGQNSLLGILGEIFSPYISGTRPRVEISGSDVEIDDRSATPLALLFHELATNAAKYGALSRAEGTVSLHIERTDGACQFTWRERGGPVITTPGPDSFGTRLISLSVERQLGGRISRDWAAEGLLVSLDIPLRSMSRNSAPAA
ncbi:MAG TPA: PAS domain-containing protein [Sphingobium sp.]